jgi:hypothetical protein
MSIDSSVKRIMKPEQPVWLTALQNDLALITAQEAKKIWPHPETQAPYFNYRLEHVQQVERDALRILEDVKADEEILLAAVWVHDRFQTQLENEKHAHQAAAWTRENLAGLGFPAQKVDQVVYAVERHCDQPGQIPAGAVEARILWDADRLTRIGPLSIINYMLGHAAFPEMRLSYNNIALLGLEKLERSRRLVEEFYYQRSRELALSRFQQQKAFFEAFAQDVQA